MNPNVLRHIRAGWNQIPSSRKAQDDWGFSADPNTEMAAGRIVGDYLAIGAPGIRRLIRVEIGLAAGITIIALTMIGFGALRSSDFLFAGCLVLPVGIYMANKARRNHRLLSTHSWEEWPAGALRVNAYRFWDGGQIPVLMLFDFTTGARHILMVPLVGEGRDFYRLKGSILFCGDIEQGGLVYIPGGEKYYAAVGKLAVSKDADWNMRDRFDIQWPPGDPADWPTPHAAFKRDWPGAPRGYLSGD
ncbi:MAG: hypothetical protein ACRDKE_00320 [Solirubrobacterales bacterium]